MECLELVHRQFIIFSTCNKNGMEEWKRLACDFFGQIRDFGLIHFKVFIGKILYIDVLFFYGTVNWRHLSYKKVLEN